MRGGELWDKGEGRRIKVLDRNQSCTKLVGSIGEMQEKVAIAGHWTLDTGQTLPVCDVIDIVF